MKRKMLSFLDKFSKVIVADHITIVAKCYDCETHNFSFSVCSGCNLRYFIDI